MDLTMFINAALSAAGGGGVVGALVLALYKNSLKKEEQQREAERQERKELSEKLEVLEKEKFAELKRDFDEHVKSAKAGEIMTKLDLLAGSVQKLTDLTTKTLGCVVNRFVLYYANVKKGCRENGECIRTT